jgi:hypothetical protein
VEFLVEFDINVPDGAARSEVEEQRPSWANRSISVTPPTVTGESCP